MDFRSQASLICQPTVRAVPQLSICWPSLPVNEVATVLFHGVVGAGCSTVGGNAGRQVHLDQRRLGARPRFSCVAAARVVGREVHVDVLGGVPREDDATGGRVDVVVVTVERGIVVDAVARHVHAGDAGTEVVGDRSAEVALGRKEIVVAIAELGLAGQFLAAASSRSA